MLKCLFWGAVGEAAAALRAELEGGRVLQVPEGRQGPLRGDRGPLRPRSLRRRGPSERSSAAEGLDLFFVNTLRIGPPRGGHDRRQITCCHR